MASQDHTDNEAGEPPAIARVRSFYTHFGKQVLADIPEIYAENVEFRDPVHRIEGLPALQAYFARTCENITQCQFTFHAVHLQQDNQAWLEWRMDYAHPRLNGGALLALDGVSHMRFDERITSHRDYFDLGAMLYEHVPVVGGAVRWLKKRMGA